MQGAADASASAASSASLQADMLILLRQQVTASQNSGLDEVTSTLKEILRRTESQAASPVNNTSMLNLMTSLADSVAVIADDMQEVKAGIQALSSQAARQHEMLTDLVTGESRIPTLFCCSLEVPSTKLQSIKAMFQVSACSIFVFCCESVLLFNVVFYCTLLCCAVPCTRSINVSFV